MSLALQLQRLTTRIANHFRDVIAPRLIPPGGVPGQYLSPKVGGGYEWLDVPTYTGTPTDDGYADALLTLNNASAVLAGYLDSVETVTPPTGGTDTTTDPDLASAESAVLAAASSLAAYINLVESA